MLSSAKIRNILRVTQCVVFRRYLSVNETATALRPFYFAVHPDLFGRFPKAQITNEDSLKRLNEHLSRLHGRHRVAPISLLFYVRNTCSALGTGEEDKPLQLTPANFKAVRISLLSETLRDAVKTVLRSCNLPLSYIESIAANTCTPQHTIGPDRPIKWHHTYNLSRVTTAEAHEIRKKAEITLSTWIQKNQGRAHSRLAAHEPKNLDTQRLITEVKKQTGLLEVLWLCNWGVTQFRACLKGFLRLYEQNKLDINLAGRKLVFGSETGVCVGGSIVLRHDDVPDGWLRLLLSLKKHEVVQNKIPAAERHLSSLLNDIQIARRPEQPVVLADTYLSQLRRMTGALKSHMAKNPDDGVYGHLNDVEMVLIPATSALMISPEGQIFVPATCPAFLIIDFLNQYAEQARSVKQEYERSDQLESQLVKECLNTLGLKSLTKDQNITSLQMEACCVRLLEESKHTNLGLEGCRLKVAEFYSVMSDGEMCVPWKWKSCRVDKA